jgi:hypothetical protein
LHSSSGQDTEKSVAKDAVRNWWTRLLARFGQFCIRRASISRGGFVYLPPRDEVGATYVPQESVLLYLLTRSLGKSRREQFNTDLKLVAGAIRLGIVDQPTVEVLVLRAVRHRAAAVRPDAYVLLDSDQKHYDSEEANEATPADVE